MLMLNIFLFCLLSTCTNHFKYLKLKKSKWFQRMVLVLKTELNGDLRRIPLHNDFLTFDELHLMLCRVYSCDIGMVCQYNLYEKVDIV